MTSNPFDLDPHFVKCIGYLYSSKTLRKGDNVPLQYMLEEAIFQKSGVVKDFTDLFQSVLPQREPQTILGAFEESKGSSSDNELELDLFKDDLMCIVCNGMDVAAKNRLLECADCHSLYHQECHTPVVIGDDSFENWVCNKCKEASKVILSPPEKTETVPVVTTSSSTKTSKSSSNSTSHHRHSSSYKSSSSSKSNDKYKSSSSKSSSPSHSSPSKQSLSGNSSSTTSSSSSRSNVQPNINIISADKRIQSMKRKAATKLQEKRKLPR